MNFTKVIKKKFAVKVFVAFTILIFIISFSFTAFYVHHQYRSLTDTLIKNGKLLAGILAYNSRIGVFSENEALLKDPVEGIIVQEGVLEVSIFNSEGVLLNRQERHGVNRDSKLFNKDGGLSKKALEKIKANKSPFYIDGGGILEFWSPVISDSGYFKEESLFFERGPVRKRGPIMGFVRITLDKEILSRQQIDLLLKSILMGILFLMMGSGVTYFVVKGITKPLNRLTEGVKSLESGGHADKVPVDTDDEIGQLAMAFNKMSESLKIRRDALKESEKRLRFLSSQLIKSQEQERKRVSKGLHDEMGQALALLKHRLRSIQRKLPQGQSSLQEECDDTSRYIDRIIDNVRRLSRDLSPSILEDLGLSAAFEWLIENFSRQHSVQTSVEIIDIDRLFAQEIQTNLYRIFQEALTNIGKHALADHVAFVVKKENSSVVFFIEDNGKGFDVNEAMTGNIAERGMGLTAMNERANMIGANLDIRSRPGEGARITLKIPV